MITSADNTNYITVDAFNNGIQELKQDLKAEIQAINVRIDATNDKITDLQSSISSYFMLATIF